MRENQAKKEAQLGLGNISTSYNQVEQLEKEVQYWKAQCEELKMEALQLYRRLYGQSQYDCAAATPMKERGY